MGKTISGSVLDLIDSIRNSDDYREYTRCEAVLRKYPGMLEQIMDLRKQTIELYHMEDEEALMRGTEELDRKYEEIQKIPEVNSFLEAEEAILRILQDISTRVTDALNLFTPDI